MTDETELHRQVHPTFIKATGQVTSQPFRPLGRGETLVSVYDGCQISARDSWTHYRKTGNPSAGVMTVLSLECTELALKVDPAPEDFQEHVHIDYREIEINRYEFISKKLRNKALGRGWSYRPDPV